MNTFTEAGAQSDFAEIRHFALFLKLADVGFDFEGWLRSLDIPKTEWCPFWEQHSNKDEGFKPYSAPGERWGCTCLHDCRKDLNRGCGRIDPITHEPKQDRAKYLYAQGLRHGITDAAQWLEWCDDDVKKAWARHFTKDRAEQQEPVSSRLVLVKASTIRPKVLDWLVDGIVPCKMMTCFGGPTGVAKSQAILHVVAGVTRGFDFARGTLRLAARQVRKPRSAIVITGEDPLEEVVIPRLIAAGADMERVYIIQGREITHSSGVREEQRFSMEHAYAELGAHLEGDREIGLITLDPANHFVGKIDANANNEVRNALDPMVRLAETYNLGFVLGHHTRKDSKFTNPTEMLGGSAAFAQLARSIVMFAPTDPQHPKETQYVCEVIKRTVGISGEAWLYEIEGHPVYDDDGKVINISRFNIIENEKPKHSIWDLLRGNTGAARERQSDEEAARDWLRQVIPTGHRPATDVIKEGDKIGHAKRTLQRALRREPAMETRPSPKFQGGSLWFAEGVSAADADVIVAGLKMQAAAERAAAEEAVNDVSAADSPRMTGSGVTH